MRNTESNKPMNFYWKVQVVTEIKVLYLVFIARILILYYYFIFLYFLTMSRYHEYFKVVVSINTENNILIKIMFKQHTVSLMFQ